MKKVMLMLTVPGWRVRFKKLALTSLAASYRSARQHVGGARAYAGAEVKGAEHPAAARS